MKDISDRLRHSTVTDHIRYLYGYDNQEERQVADVFNRAITGQKNLPVVTGEKPDVCSSFAIRLQIACKQICPNLKALSGAGSGT